MNSLKMSECAKCKCIPELVDGRVRFFARCKCPAGDNVVYGQSVSFLDHINIDDDYLSDKASESVFDLINYNDLKQSAVDAWNGKNLIAKLQADNELLREALESAQRGLAHSNYQFVKECGQLAEKALAATAKG